MTCARMLFDVWGDGITPDQLVRAINLSVSKYCSIYHSLRDDLKLLPQFRIHAIGAEASGDYQVAEVATPTTELVLSEVWPGENAKNLFRRPSQLFSANDHGSHP